MVPGSIFDVAMFDGYYYSFANASDVVCWWDGAVACMFLSWFEILLRLLLLLSLIKDVFCMFDDRVSCCLDVLCTYFYLLVKIFGREGLLYGFIVVTLLENNMALVGPIIYYYKT